MKLYKFIKEAALQKQALNMYNGTGAAIGGALGGTAGWYGSDFFTKDKTIKTIAAILGALGLGYAGYKGGNKLNNQINGPKGKSIWQLTPQSPREDWYGAFKHSMYRHLTNNGWDQAPAQTNEVIDNTLRNAEQMVKSKKLSPRFRQAFSRALGDFAYRRYQLY